VGLAVACILHPRVRNGGARSRAICGLSHERRSSPRVGLRLCGCDLGGGSHQPCRRCDTRPGRRPRPDRRVSAPPLTKRLKLSYGLGSTAESLVFTATTSFLLLFYNQVRGLPAAEVGIALASGLFINAVFDPLIG